MGIFSFLLVRNKVILEDTSKECVVILRIHLDSSCSQGLCNMPAIKRKKNQITVPELKELTDYLEHQIINSYNKTWNVLKFRLELWRKQWLLWVIEGNIKQEVRFTLDLGMSFLVYVKKKNHEDFNLWNFWMGIKWNDTKCSNKLAQCFERGIFHQGDSGASWIDTAPKSVWFLYFCSHIHGVRMTMDALTVKKKRDFKEPKWLQAFTERKEKCQPVWSFKIFIWSCQSIFTTF